MDELLERHRRACDGFAQVAHTVPAGGWDAPSPCAEGDARAVVEHVIGFHELLVLRPLGVRAHRPRQGPAERWDATATALFAALGAQGALDRTTELPGGGTNTPRAVLDTLTTEMLVHTWDLARATGGDEHLDEELVAHTLAQMRPLDEALRGHGFADKVPVDAGADAQTELLCFLGRQP